MLEVRSAVGEGEAPAPAAVRRDDVRDRTASGQLLEAALLLVVFAQVAFTPYTHLGPKMVGVVAAALLVTLRRDTFRSPLVWPAAAWITTVGLATATSVDRWNSLMGREDMGNGLILLTSCALLLLAGTRARALGERLGGWLVAAGVAATVLAVGFRFSPSYSERVFGRSLGFEGMFLPPLGHPVYIGAFLAVALAATAALAKRRPVPALAAAVILACGLSVTGKRGVLLAAVLGLAVAGWRSGLARRRLAVLLGAVAVVVSAWTAVDVVTRPETPVSAARRFDELLSGSARARPFVWLSSARAWAARPVTGWGPANTWGANMSVNTADEARMTGRVWTDAHNLIVESTATTGVVGLAALLGLFVAAARRMRHATGAAGWAVGGVAALAVHHSLQPIHVSLTPLFFLLIGLAASQGERMAVVAPEPRALARPRRVARVIVATALLAALPLVGLRFAASWYEGHGRRYYSPDLASFRTALRLEPRRVLAGTHLAGLRALDAHSDDPTGAAEARAQVAQLVREHPWDLSVRLVAAQVEVVLENPEAADRWLADHLERFPHDSWAMSYRAFVKMLRGDAAQARYWIDRSLAIDPTGPATRLVDDAGRPRTDPYVLSHKPGTLPRA